jgi:hypothetical protein
MDSRTSYGEETMLDKVGKLCGRPVHRSILYTPGIGRIPVRRSCEYALKDYTCESKGPLEVGEPEHPSWEAVLVD